MTDNFPISSGVAMPVVTRGAREQYPFDKLGAPTKDKDGNPVYQSFPVMKDAKKMNSTVYSANKRYQKEVTDKDGKPVLGENGKPLVEKTREFKVYTVDPATDPDKAVSRVFRVK